MRHENPPYICGNTKDFGIRYANDTAIDGTKKINGGLAAAKANDNLMIEVCIGQEARPHGRTEGVCARTSAIFA